MGNFGKKKKIRMKIIIILLCFFVSVAMVFAQQQTFDISTFTPPKGWKQQVGKDAIQLSKDDAAKGTYCLITLYKAIVITNTDVYEKETTAFLESISFKKSATDAQPAPGNNNENAAIVGTWGKKAGVNPSYADPVATGNAGYSKDQYTFNTNGTYSFASKTFRYSSNKDGTDKWGNLLSTQNRLLEKVSYTFTKHYFSGIEEWNLVLQASQVTGRDGPFSNNTTFSNAWYYAPISSINPVIEMPIR